MSNLNSEEKQKILNSVLGINNDDDFQSFKPRQIEPDLLDKITDFFSRERGLERSKKLEDNIRYYLGPYAGSLGQANQLLNPIVGLQDAGEATREGRYVDAITDTATAALPIAGALAVKPLARGVQSGIDEAVDAVTEVMTGGTFDKGRREVLGTLVAAPVAIAAGSTGIMDELIAPLAKKVSGSGTLSASIAKLKNLEKAREIENPKGQEIFKRVRDGLYQTYYDVMDKSPELVKHEKKMKGFYKSEEEEYIKNLYPLATKENLTKLSNKELKEVSDKIQMSVGDTHISRVEASESGLDIFENLVEKLNLLKEEYIRRDYNPVNKDDFGKPVTATEELDISIFFTKNPEAEGMKDYEKFIKDNGVKKFNHGGDVPHADEPYLDGKAENIVKKFNEPNDEFLDTAIELAAKPLQEAKEAFMKAGKGAVFEMLPKDNPKVYQAFRQTNDYLAGLGYAGFKTGEAALTFVAGSIADALGQDKGEIGYQILRDEKTAARDIMGAGEAFAGMVGPRSIQMLDDAIDAFGGYFKLLKTAEPAIKADLGGKLQALADGDFDFLNESPTPKTISAQITGQGTTPVDQPDPKSLTTPKSLVSPLFKTARPSNLTTYPDYGDKNPFYSSLLTALDNLPVGKKGVKGSNVIKYLTKNAPNINMKELYWSGMLENAPMRGTVGYKGSNQDIQGIDPDKTYTKDSLIRMADASVPQIGVRKFTSLSTKYQNQPQWRGMQQVPMNIFTLEPITVGASSTTPARSRVANTRRNDNGQAFTHRIGRGNFEGGQSPNSEYVEYLITNVNSRGSTYPKSDAHWQRKVDGKNETVLAHVRGSFIPIIYPTSTRITKGTVGKGEIKRGHTTTNVFVVDEIQADPAQKSPAEVRADKPSAVASQKTSKETAKISTAPEVDVKTALTTNLTKAIDEIGRPPEFIPTSDRFNRIFGVDENDAFSVQTDKVNQGLKEIAETLADVEKKFLANDLDRDEVAEVISATFNDSLKTTAILRNTTGPGAFPEAIMNQIKLNVLGDLIYGKGVVKRTPVLKTKLEEVILNSLGGKPIAPTDITPVGTGDSIRLGLLSIMREAVKKKTNTIVIPPVDDLMKAHSLGEKSTKETYEDAMMKALRILRSETNKKVSFTKGKIDGLQFDSDKNYLIINFDSDIVDETKQTRFAEGGLV